MMLPLLPFASLRVLRALLVLRVFRVVPAFVVLLSFLVSPDPRGGGDLSDSRGADVVLRTDDWVGDSLAGELEDRGVPAGVASLLGFLGDELGAAGARAGASGGGVGGHSAPLGAADGAFLDLAGVVHLDGGEERAAAAGALPVHLA
ncbi:hypothetical protein EXU48_23875 [Occultella glacieicola]|uniref:Secreted protein n=1 Tax=Occultella glacieicola TaxID=2518684 RepID=A0ABY2DWI9_9MICO|nr:hypothetical protein [Occultella glacieicola]TDE88163.1 hypothetical protein EXU48_23875 [Occultella glacieicola]